MPWHECSVVMLREKFVRFAGEEGNSQWPSLPAIVYGPDDSVRKVQDRGLISFRNREFRVDHAFKGQPVALRATPVDWGPPQGAPVMGTGGSKHRRGLMFTKHNPCSIHRLRYVHGVEVQAGMGPENLVKIVIGLVDRKYGSDYREVRDRMLGDVLVCWEKKGRAIA